MSTARSVRPMPVDRDSRVFSDGLEVLEPQERLLLIAGVFDGQTEGLT